MTVAGLIHNRHKSKPPALEALAACNWLSGWRASREKEPDNSFSHKPSADARRAVPMSSTHTNTSRGEAVRAALVAIVRARAVADLPLPTHRTMAAVLGISPGQVTRHLAVLMDAGAFSARNAGMRIRVEEVRP